jgi:hypothetical protein
MEIKTLYTCGCSFMSMGLVHRGVTSFLDLYAKEKNFNHVSLGRSGATNFLIRLQIEEAISQDADYVIIGATSSDRIDFPLLDKEDQLGNHVTIHDVEYRGYNSFSENNVSYNDTKMISDSISNFTYEKNYKLIHNNQGRREITPEMITAMHHYLAYLHSNKIQITKDYFMISDGLRKLQALNKPFIFIDGPLRHGDWTFLGDKHWKGLQPWDMPYGFSDATITHNPQIAHNDFLQTLLDLTPDWK